MAIEQTNVVDAAGLDRETGEAVLTLIDALAWEDASAHLRLLQAKLETYLAFVESGEVFESYPAARGRAVRIDAIFRYAPTGDAAELLQRAKEVGAGLAVSLTWQVRAGG